MRYGQIIDSKVANALVADAEFAERNGLVLLPDTVDIGWLYVDGEFSPPPAPVKPPEQIQAEIVTATQKRLDDFAKTRNYDGILSVCTYAADLNPKFASEGQYCIDARGATWTKLYEILAEVEAGTRPMPSSYADIEFELPPLVWPN